MIENMRAIKVATVQPNQGVGIMKPTAPLEPICLKYFKIYPCETI